MVSRRKFLLGGSAGLTFLAIGGAAAVSAAAAEEVASDALAPLTPAPATFVALADELSGHIGVDRVLINRSFRTLSGILPDLESTAAQLVTALPQMASITDPQGRLAALAVKGDALKDLFLRLNTALYLGTVDDKAGQRECIGFEANASFQVVSDYVQPPSYCTGSPNFWTEAPTIKSAEGAANV